MKKLLYALLFLCTILFGDNVKELTLACDSYEDIINTKNIEESMRDGAIPKNCLLLTSNANVSVIDNNLDDSRIVKILIIDLGTYMYTLKQDVIITNENKI